MANLAMLTRHVVGFLVSCSPHVPPMPLSVVRYGACRWSGRRCCVWTGPLQRNFIHDIFKLLKDDVALGLGRCTAALWAITTPSPRGEWPLPPGLLRWRRAAWTLLLQVWGVETRSLDTHPFQRSFLEFRSIPQVETAAAALRLGAAARRYHRYCRSLWCTQALKTWLQFICCSREPCFPRWSGCCAWAAALVVLWQRAWGPHGVEQLARHTPQTRLFIDCWLSFCVKLHVLWCFCDVLEKLRLSVFGPFLEGLFSGATNPIFHRSVSAVAECLRLLSIGAHFPSPDLLLPADDITAYEYLLTLRVFWTAHVADFCSGERRLFLSLRRRNHLVSHVDWRVSSCVFPGKEKCCCFFISSRLIKKCHFQVFLELKQKCFSHGLASRWSASCLRALPHSRSCSLSTTCGSSGPPSPCLLAWVGHQTGTRRRPAAGPADSSSGNAPCRSTSWTTTSSRRASACSARPVGDQEKPSTGRSRTRSWPTSKLFVPPQPQHSLKTSRSAARSSWIPSPATGSSTCWTSGRESGRWDMRRCMCEVQHMCPGVFEGTDKNTPYRWKRSAPRAETRGRRSMLTPADMTRLSECIMKVTDVLCLSAVTIHGLVLEWLDAGGLDVRPGYHWVWELLRGMRLSFRMPAKCVKELHSPALQEANTHRLFIKLCWLMDKHAVDADRVVNIDETSCRLLPVHHTGWGHRGKKQAQLQGNTKEATTFTVAFSMDRGPLDMLVQIVHAGKTDAVLPEKPWRERTHHVTSENGWATTTTILQLAAALDNVLNPSRGTAVDPPLGHGQRGHAGSHAGHIPSRRAVLPPATKHVVPAALRRGRLPQLQELHSDAGHSCPLRPWRHLRRLGHEPSMAAPVFGWMGSSRSHGPLREEPGVDDWLASLAYPHRRRFPRCSRRGRGAPRPRWALRQAHHARTGWGGSADVGHGRRVRRWRRRHSTACRCRRTWADWHAANSGIRTSHVQPGAVHRSAPPVRRWTTMSLVKNSQPSWYHIVLSVVTRARCPVCGVSLLSHASVVFVLCVLPRIPWFYENQMFLFLGGGGGGKGKSDALKRCPHKVISAHALACTASNRPWFWGCLSPGDRWMHGFVHVGQPTVLFRDSASFCVNAWICAARSTDRDLESRRAFLWECLDMSSSGNRPWSWVCQRNERKKRNAWICAPRTSNHDLPSAIFYLKL